MFIRFKSACNFIRIRRVYRLKNISTRCTGLQELIGCQVLQETLDLIGLLGTLQTGFLCNFRFHTFTRYIRKQGHKQLYISQVYWEH